MRQKRGCFIPKAGPQHADRQTLQRIAEKHKKERLHSWKLYAEDEKTKSPKTAFITTSRSERDAGTHAATAPEP